jgi:hypothetical protein
LQAAKRALERVSNRHQLDKAYGRSEDRRAANLEDLRLAKGVFREIADQEVASEHARKLSDGAGDELAQARTPNEKRSAIENAVVSIIQRVRSAGRKGQP